MWQDFCCFLTVNNITIWGFPGGSDSKESACNVKGLGSIPGLGRSPGEGNDNPLQYSFLGNPMGRRCWQVTAYGVTKSRTQMKSLRTHAYTAYHYLLQRLNTASFNINTHKTRLCTDHLTNIVRPESQAYATLYFHWLSMCGDLIDRNCLLLFLLLFVVEGILNI